MKALFLFLSLFFVLLNGYSQSTNNSTDVKRVGITKPRIGKITATTFDIILDGKVFETVEYVYSKTGSLRSIAIGIDTWEFNYAFINSKENYIAYNCYYLSETALTCLNDGLNFRNYVFKDFLVRYYY